MTGGHRRDFADGTIVVGRSHRSTSDQAFRWTSDVGLVGLGFLLGGLPQSGATAISAAGRVIVNPWLSSQKR